MSMLGNFRQISPALLERLKKTPSLVTKVVRYRPPGEPPQSDAEAFISLLPAHMRNMMDDMPPEMRADWLAHVGASVAEMPDVLKDQIAAARRPKAATEIDPSDVGAELDVAKTWHALHFLLCGSTDAAPGPLGSAVLGGTAIGPDLGYGPARYLEPPEVKAVAGALASLTTPEFVARFDPVAMDEQKVYPGHWLVDGEEKDWLSDAFRQLQAFYDAAAQGGCAVLLYLV
jgi:hypothetical protein